MGNMKALVWEGPRKIKLKEIETPRPKEGELLIKTKSVGVCGSDLEIYKGGFAHSVPPLILGHEACGVVEEVSESVENIQVGERIVVDPGIFCGKCEFCRNGSYWQCNHRDILGMQKHNGAYAEYFVMPHLSCYSIPGDMDWNEAALIDILADPLHALNMMPLQIGETVAVFGPGPGPDDLAAVGVERAEVVTVLDDQAPGRDHRRGDVHQPPVAALLPGDPALRLTLLRFLRVRVQIYHSVQLT